MRDPFPRCTTAFADSDRGSIAICTGGSIQFTVPPSAAVGNGWFMNYKNAGSGTVTIDSAGSETFDGLSSLSLAVGEACTVIADGVNYTYLKY